MQVCLFQNQTVNLAAVGVGVSVSSSQYFFSRR